MTIKEEELRKHRCCFTGHRPEKLHQPEWLIKMALEKEICFAIDDGFTVFISGMSRGVDIWASEIVLKLRSKGLPLRLICAIPHPDFEKRWDDQWQMRYKGVLESADLVRTISPAYRRGVYQIRNEWLVDHSSRVIAVFNGQPSGTMNTIEYAIAKGVPVRIIRR